MFFNVSLPELALNWSAAATPALFTNTVSHKMVRTAVTEAEKCNADIIRCHTSSGNALSSILEQVC